MGRYDDGDNRRNRNNASVYHERRQRRKRKRVFILSVLIFSLFMLGFTVSRLFQNTSDPSQELSFGQDVEDEMTEKPVQPFNRASTAEGKVLPSTMPGRANLNGLMAGTNHSIYASKYAFDTAQVKDWMRGRVPYDGGKIAFLTFDDGPVETTYQVLDILKRRGVPGTFFIPGVTLNNHRDQEILHRYIEEGHGIATHSYSHDYAYLYPGRSANEERIVNEYRKSLELMQDTLGEDFETRVFRFPGGSMSWNNISSAQDALRRIGVADIDWNSISGDAEPLSRRPDGAEAMADYVMETLSDQPVSDIAVVLMHDSRDITTEYLDMVIDRFIEEGYSFGILR